MSYTNALVTISLAMLAYLIAGVWWAATINTILKGLTTAVETLNKTLIKHEERHYSKTEASKDQAILDKKIEAAFNKIDDNSRRINQIEIRIG